MQRVLRAVVDLIRTYAVKFGVVGILAYVVDVAVFNGLVVLLGGTSILGEVLPARIVAFAASTIFAWVGNRWWTFRDRRRDDLGRELLEYVAVAIGGLAIVAACLGISHYLLGFDSLLADNISTNGVGFVLATAFRFLAYRYWVWGDRRSSGSVPGRSAAGDATETMDEYRR